MFRIKWMAVILLSSFCLMAFDQDDDAERAVIEAEIERQLNAYKKYKMKQCQLEATRQAKKQVDAFFIALDKENENKGALYPIPGKPTKPEWEKRGDTSSIRPLFKRDSSAN